MCIFIHWQTHIVVVMDIAMFVGVKQEDIVHVGYLVSLLPVLVSWQYVKYDSTWRGVVGQFKFETVFVLLSL